MNVGDDIMKLIMGGTPVRRAKKAAKPAKKASGDVQTPPPVAPKTNKSGLPRLKPGEYVRDRQRTAFPGIYGRPDEIAREAAANTAPEDPAMKLLFGVTREELLERSKKPRVNPSIVRLPENARGSQAAKNIKTDRNRQRMVDTLAEAQKYPELATGMMEWYNMDPAYDVLRQISNNPEENFRRFNTFSGMASPGSDVLTELRRGTMARMLAEQGRMEDWQRYGGNPNHPNAPEDMRGGLGHPYSTTAHGIPMAEYERTGEIGMKSPKVPPYIQSSLPESMGGTWTTPVGDAHFSRAIGLADTRRGAEFGKSISTPELAELQDWWSGISRDVGMQEVPAQALSWGTFAKHTGVETPTGAPKLELLAQAIMRRAAELGVDPKAVRDAVLTGRMRLAVPATGVGAGLLSQEAEGDPKSEIEDYLGGL